MILSKLRKIIVVSMLLLLKTSAFSQHFRFEGSVRGNALASINAIHSELDEETSHLPGGVGFEVLYMPLDFFGLGVHYNRSVFSGKQFFFNRATDDLLNRVTSSHDFLNYGLTLQVSVNKTRKVQPFAVVRLSKVQVVDRFSNVTLARSGNQMSGGFGLTLKITKHLSYTVFEANYIFPSDDFAFPNNKNEGALFAQSGVTIKFIKNRK